MKYSNEELRKLRNEIRIDFVIERILDMPAKLSEGYLRFLCPHCREFNTATNPKTNLARCFRCQRNFNPIDLLMVVRDQSFPQAVESLRKVHQELRRLPAPPSESRVS